MLGLRIIGIGAIFVPSTWADHPLKLPSNNTLCHRGPCRTHRSTVSIAPLILTIGLVGCGRHSLSGEYIASTPKEVDRLQLIETTDGHLSGQFEISALEPDGKIKYTNLAVSGAADGPDVSLSLKPSNPLLESVDVSGTLSWRGLTLTGGFTGGHSSTFVLRRGDLDQYQTALDALNKHSIAVLKARKTEQERVAAAEARAKEEAVAAAAQAKAEHEQQDFASGVVSLCDKMRKFETAASATLQKFPEVKAKYHAITAKMADYLQHDRILSGVSNASYTRSQISYAMGNGMYATNQIHFEIQSLQNSFVSDVGPEMQTAEHDVQICRNTNAPIPAVDSACESLQSLYPAYLKAYRDVAAGLDELENVYQTELGKQQHLKAQADQIN